jgi:hypothetical protein
MIIEHSSSSPIELKSRLCQVVLENKISSIEKLSVLTGMEEEEARIVLQELVSEGSLSGKFTEDGLRFFLSDVKVSEAPIHAPADIEPEIEVKDTRVPKIVVLSGIILMAVGYILRGITTMGDIMENAGGAVFLVGLAVLLVGWLMFSRLNPPSEKRP